MSRRRNLLAAAFAFFLASPALAAAGGTEKPWAEALAERRVDPASVPDPLRVTEEMRRFAEEAAPAGRPAPERLAALQRALYDPSRFRFAYDERGTLPAPEAFERRGGNCVAFTNLFLALGRSLGLPLSAGLAAGRRGAEKEGDLVVVRSHVVATMPWGPRLLVFDFFSAEADAAAGIRPLSDLELAAVFLGNLGVDEIRAGRPEKALSVLSDAVRLGPEIAALHVGLGVALWHVGRVADAETAFRTARARDPGEVSAAHDLASLLAARGERQEALRLLRAADLGRAPGPTWLLRGNLELALGKLPDAVRSFRKAHALSPRSVEPLLAVARAEEARGRHPEATAALREALALRPGDPDVLRLLDGR
ncbi:tetratricopeptide repeat protein [Acidobacteria bacterium ACD]|nr:MAG: hypothetical protein EDX89_10290 [Acidobacteriota bacterium]MDL1951114.1 tetratricopeptide repeat protein [Acidobacteria bacterium ACD]